MAQLIEKIIVSKTEENQFFLQKMVILFKIPFLEKSRSIKSRWLIQKKQPITFNNKSFIISPVVIYNISPGEAKILKNGPPNKNERSIPDLSNAL